MTEKYDHTVLIVDDEDQIGKSIGRLLKSIDVKYIYMESGEAGLKKLKTTTVPFSLILSDQRMQGMKGSEFLEQAREIAPNAIRFLMTGYTDVDAVTDAVNKGSIHRYIAKPWDNVDFLEAVKYGLEQHEKMMENNRLFELAKHQNTKLYTLNTKLKESSDEHKKTILKLDQDIAVLNKKLDEGAVNRDYVKEIEAAIKNKNMLHTESFNSLYTALISELFEQFQEIAIRNGFEMPAGLKGKSDG